MATSRLQQQSIDRLLEEIETEKLLLDRALKSPILEKVTQLKNDIDAKNKLEENKVREREKKIELDRAKLEKDYKEIDEARNNRVIQLAQVMLDNFQNLPPMIEIVVGGKLFSTSPGTLFKKPDCVLARTLAEMVKSDVTKSKNRIKIDRDPTHFQKILNYLRDGEHSLFWLEEKRVVDMKEVISEAEFYVLDDLVQRITLALVTLKPRVTKPQDLCQFLPTMHTNGSVFFQTQGEEEIIEENFSECKFQKVIFLHTQHFRFCNFEGAIFRDCLFQVVLNFGGSSMKGVRFINCKALLLSPLEIFVVDKEQEIYIPKHWVAQ